MIPARHNLHSYEWIIFGEVSLLDSQSKNHCPCSDVF
jgi:hypothetical protein